MNAYSPLSRRELERTLSKSFVEGVSWPLDQASLAALTDMGLSAEQIAHYFSVDPAEVRDLLDPETVRSRQGQRLRSR
jgi:hypothetical protein